MTYYDDGGAGASSARNKLAGVLRGFGIRVYGNPPDDADFVSAIKEWANIQIRDRVAQARKEERKYAQARIDATRPPIAPRPLTWKERFTGKVSKP